MNATLDLARPALTELLLALLDRGKQVRIAVDGTSMEPVICNGDVVILAAAPAEAICRGDLLLCRTSTGGLVLHRLMRVFGARSERAITANSRGCNAAPGPAGEGARCTGTGYRRGAFDRWQRGTTADLARQAQSKD